MIKTKTALRLAAVIAMTAGIAGAQTAGEPVDPGGWSRAKWGMTQAQVSEAFPGQAQNYPAKYGGGSLLGLNGVRLDVSPITYSVRFHFDKDARLSQVVIEPEGDPLVMPRPAKDNLLGALTDKYGNPHADAPVRDGHSTDYDWSWTVGKTVISLSYSDRGYVLRPNFTVLGYRLRQTNDAL